MRNNNVAFIGGGNMTRAFLGGLIESGVPAYELFVSEPADAARERLGQRYTGVTVYARNDKAVSAAGTVVFAVKPQDMRDVCTSLRDTVQATQPLIISIAAGTQIDSIDEWLGRGLSVVRVMPNQPAIHRLGVSGVFANDQTSIVERDRAEAIIGAISKVVHVAEESDLDTVTAVSGTGPAYFFLMIDMLIDAAVELGIERESAELLAVETAKGAAAIAESETESMQSLITRVTSPGGTTEAAFRVLEDAGIRDIFLAAVTAARDRSAELGSSK
ncbi:MAG: pyrroline-5-carboxylate reductase [Woeseiaceae bacterium]